MRKRDVPFENPTVMARSKAAHAEDVRHNSPKLGFKPNKARDDRSEKSKEFERRWLGGGS